MSNLRRAGSVVESAARRRPSCRTWQGAPSLYRKQSSRIDCGVTPRRFIPLEILRMAMQRKICIFGTHHAYQYRAVRTAYLQHVRDLISIHSVDLVAEEATGIDGASYAQRLIESLFKSQISWKNVDLTRDERRIVPDIGGGTLVDFDLHTLREWVWVIRTAKAVKSSALLICGFAHTFSVAEKFQFAGFQVETNVYFDRLDEDNIKNAQAVGPVG
jgi:hypothetical protein